LAFAALIQISFSGKNLPPVLLHIDNDPAFGISPVEGLVQRADVALAIVSLLAIRIRVVNEEPQSSTFAGHGVLNHLHVGIGIWTESGIDSGS